MAYFKLHNPVALRPYPFDFHSHFSGILPVENDAKSHERHEIKISKGSSIVIEKGQELSIIGMLMRHRLGRAPRDEEIDAARRKAHYRLFALALRHMEKSNPFADGDLHAYRRGECAAENIYLACSIILRLVGRNDVYPIGSFKIYRAVLSLLESGTIDADNFFHLIAYFNRKLFSANKYTPFDDVYWMRDAIRGCEEYQDAFNVLTLCYLAHEGILYTQTAASVEAAKKLNGYFEAFNDQPLAGGQNTSYKLLAHTAHVYLGREEFNAQLEAIAQAFVLDSGNNPAVKNLVGIDLLGAETKTGLYEDFFSFLCKSNNLATFRKYVGMDDTTKPTKPTTHKIILHIHCGEGSGVSDSNRSLCGYFLRNAPQAVPEKFFRLLADYAFKCYCNTLRQAQARRRERAQSGRKWKYYGEVSGLFDELYYLNRLTVDGVPLHRFDINSPLTRSQTAYCAKANVENLCRALEAVGPSNKPYYELLSGENSPYSIRVGHAYHGRNYLTSRFPALYYDTNLGSNFITGASGAFDSAQAYRLNRGLRHLDGLIDTDILQRTLDAVAYLGASRLSLPQIALIEKLTAGYRTKEQFDERLMKQLMGDIPQPILTCLDEFLQLQIKTYWHVISQIDGLENEEKERRKHLTCRLLFAVALNWRSYLLGADGQGVEHSHIQDELLRMTILLGYGVDIGLERIPEEAISCFGRLILKLAGHYWRATLENIPEDVILPTIAVQRLDGFASPGSIAWVESKKVP